jgi:hypothetical protein
MAPFRKSIDSNPKKKKEKTSKRVHYLKNKDASKGAR